MSSHLAQIPACIHRWFGADLCPHCKLFEVESELKDARDQYRMDMEWERDDAYREGYAEGNSIGFAEGEMSNGIYAAKRSKALRDAMKVLQ